MPSSTFLDLNGIHEPEDQSTCTSSDAGVGPEQPQLSPMQVNSPRSEYSLQNNRAADSHSSRIYFHQRELHSSSEDHLISSHGSKVNSASDQATLNLQPSRSSNLSTSEGENSARFSPYLVPQKPLTSPKSSNQSDFSNKTSKPRKRTVILKPKCPKYEGLSNFAAPVDLVSDIIPCSNTLPVAGSTTITTTTTTTSSSPLNSVSSLTGSEKMSLEQPTDSLAAEDNQAGENSQTPIDFLKYLDFDEWDRRKQDLLQMVEDRKNLFLLIGFAETSGKPFQPDEQAIEKKPIPNRWVWYMHLSTDYDKVKNTRVPPGGPAGYLKYGWDRLGPAGKQPYQELADIYSAQRLKFMAEHGIKEDTTKKKPKQPVKPKGADQASQELVIGGDGDNKQMNVMFMDEPLSPNRDVHSLSTVEPMERQISHYIVDPPYMSIQPSMQPNLFYEPLDQFTREKRQCDRFDGPAEIFGMSDSLTYSNYLRSPPTVSDFFSPIYHEDPYGFHLNGDSNEQYGSPMGLPSSPREYPFTCTPSSTVCYHAPSELHRWPVLPPNSINPAPSSNPSMFPTPRMNQSQVPPSSLNNLTLTTSFLDPLSRHEDGSPVHRVADIRS